MFNAKLQAGGVTKKCNMYRAAIQDGPIVNVIDTPGLFNSVMSPDYISKEINNFLTTVEGGIHAVLFVLSTRNRVSQEEESTFNSLQCIFESKILDYFIVVFTGGDDLEEDDRTLDDYLRENCPEFLRRVFRLCGGRKVLFNNITKDENKKAEQLKQLLAHLADVGKQTGFALENGFKCKNPRFHSRKKHIVYARDLSIKLSNNSEYWSWRPLRDETSSETLVLEAAVLRGICWLDVGGRLDTRELTPKTKYEAVYVVKLEDTASGWETPVNLKLTLPNSRARPQERSVNLKEHIGKSWVDILVGEFITSPDNDGEISFSMRETTHWQEGLIIKGVVIRPKNEGTIIKNEHA
ncbi:unnamed protein product [Arabidopsis thaliana]|uniref:(thale cress) hypothetical protein n=1 Tax=Arabidopsis thaliana TaxID=3702 RepID=A0A7G2DUT5_ARATH|nr:unnamed protein product [Arabidopsis thaliana]